MNGATRLTTALTTARRTRRANRRRPRPRNRPALRFTPYAWAKLLFLRDRGPTEVGGFGVTAEADPLLVEDLRLVRQASTAVTVRFDDAAVADFFDACVDEGLAPERFARVWVHTHPGDCPRPSGTDERTFARAFGGCDWAVMAVLARGGRSYARLRFAAGPGGELVLPVEVDFGVPFAAADPGGWAEAYARCVADETALAFGPRELSVTLGATCRLHRGLAAAAPDAALDRAAAGRNVHTLDDDPFLWEYPDELGFLNDPIF